MSPNSKRNKILVVDDEKDVCNTLKEFLQFEDFRVETAYDGESAIAKLDKFNPDCILLDVRMPYLSGVDALGMIKMRNPATQVIMVSAVTNIEIAKKCKERGAFDYINKPIQLNELLDTIQRAIHSIESEEEDIVEMVPSPAMPSTAMKEGPKHNGEKDYDSIIHFLNQEVYHSLKFCLDILDYSEPSLAWHCKNVAWLTIGIAREMDYPNLKQIELAALFHDIGKIPLQGQFRRSPSQERAVRERTLFERYPIFGEEIIQAHSHLKDIAKFVRHQCERVDGNGYPDGLKGDDIPLPSQIINVANTFDEMLELDDRGNIEIDIVEKNCDLAFQVLQREAGKRFDIGVISALRAFLEKYRDNPKKEQAVEFKDLKPSMVLSRDILASNRKPVFISGTILTQAQIQEIQDIRDIRIISNTARVYI